MSKCLGPLKLVPQRYLKLQNSVWQYCLWAEIPTDNAHSHRVPVMEQLFVEPQHCCVLHFLFFNCGWERHYQALAERKELEPQTNWSSFEDLTATTKNIKDQMLWPPAMELLHWRAMGQDPNRIYSAFVTKDQNLTIIYIPTRKVNRAALLSYVLLATQSYISKVCKKCFSWPCIFASKHSL